MLTLDVGVGSGRFSQTDVRVRMKLQTSANADGCARGSDTNVVLLQVSTSITQQRVNKGKKYVENSRVDGNRK